MASGKFKTKKSVASRISVTGTGKLMRRKPGIGHFLAKKSSRIKRNRSSEQLVPSCLGNMYKNSCGISL